MATKAVAKSLWNGKVALLALVLSLGVGIVSGVLNKIPGFSKLRSVPVLRLVVAAIPFYVIIMVGRNIRG